MARPEKVRLGEILLQQGLLTEEQLRQSLEEQKRTGRRLGRVFIDAGFVTEENICQALARQLKIRFVDLKTFDVKRELVLKLPEAQARRFRAILLVDAGSTYEVGMADPTDLFAYDELTRLLRRDIQVAVVAESQLLGTIDRTYGRTEEITELAQELGQEFGGDSVEAALLGVSAAAEEAPVVKLLQSVFESAIQLRASDIHIEPQERNLVIRFRIDGVLHIQTQADARIAAPLVLRLKLISGLDISEKRLPQDGRFNVKVRNSPVDVRISSMPTQYGESVVMRLLNQSGGVLTLDRLGMPARILERVRAVLQRPSGMILVTGPTGSGKTTTLYAALQELNTTDRKLITVEDPVEYRLPGINQVQIHDKIDLTFARVLRAALRQDPDVILVGEMRDQATVETGLRASMTGHMVLSTLHTNDAASTPARLIDMGAPSYMVAMSLQLVLAQRLIRLVCEACAQPHALLPNERHWLMQDLGDQVDTHRYRKGAGCNRCNNTGFVGRSGVYEMLEMTRAVTEAANSGNANTFAAAVREQMAGLTLRSAALRLVIEGRTTVEEAMKASSEFQD